MAPRPVLDGLSLLLDPHPLLVLSLGSPSLSHCPLLDGRGVEGSLEEDAFTREGSVSFYVLLKAKLLRVPFVVFTD